VGTVLVMERIIVSPDLEIRPDDFLALARGRVLKLSVRELELLTAMARMQGRVVPRKELYETAWGRSMRADDRSVDVYVHKLRTKLAAAVPDRDYIHTHFGLGYRLAAEPGEGTFTSISQAGNGSVTSLPPAAASLAP
jgi:DNA-binding response OmpR family regulator